LPAYLNWNAGVSSTRKIFHLDLRYYDTNLSKEDCFVLTGDPNATARRRYRPADKSRQNNALITIWLEVRVLPGPPPKFFTFDFIALSPLPPAPD
jgi:hypothetical protein